MARHGTLQKRNPRHTRAAGFWEVGCRGWMGSGGGRAGGYGVPMVTAPPQGMMFIFLEMVPV